MKKKSVLFFCYCCFYCITAFSQSNSSGYGVYLLNDGKTYATIAPFGPSPALFFSDGRVRGLKQDGNTWLIGKTLGNTNETEGKLSLENSTIKIDIDGSATLSGKKVALQEKKVSFKNGKTTLAGELIFPEGNGPFPVIVQTHGSGEETRESSRGLAYLFAANGIASLIYDKRGCGESSGKEWKASFNDYADDLLAGAAYVSTLPEINKTRIGLFGHSQGGWVVPLAYSKKPGLISFCIISAANAVSPVEQTLYAGDQEFIIKGNDEQTVKEIHDFRRIKYEVGILGKNEEEYKNSIVPAAKQKPWFALTGDRLPEGIFWKENGFYDPAPALQSLKCPVLVLYADNDISTDSKTNLPLMKKFIPSSQAEFKLFENANHMMMKVGSKNFTTNQILLITQMADGYIETVIGWLKKTTSL
ncbi:MAG: alpha/beta hydrolase [Ferruginibacter sp.]